MRSFIHTLALLIEGKKYYKAKELRQIVRGSRVHYPVYNTSYVEHTRAFDLLAYNCNQLDGCDEIFAPEERLTEQELGQYLRIFRDLQRNGGCIPVVLIALLYTPKEISIVEWDLKAFTRWWASIKGQVTEPLRREVMMEASFSEIQTLVERRVGAVAEKRSTRIRRALSLRRR